MRNFGRFDFRNFGSVDTNGASDKRIVNVSMGGGAAYLLSPGSESSKNRSTAPSYLDYNIRISNTFQICSLLRGGIAERGGIRVGHRIIEINSQSVVAVPHEKIVNMLATAIGEIHMKTMPTSMFRLLTGQEVPNYI